MIRASGIINYVLLHDICRSLLFVSKKEAQKESGPFGLKNFVLHRVTKNCNSYHHTHPILLLHTRDKQPANIMIPLVVREELGDFGFC